MKTFKNSIKSTRLSCVRDAQAYCAALRRVHGLAVVGVKFVVHWLFKTVTVLVTYRIN
jgi:hypothetical protein